MVTRKRNSPIVKPERQRVLAVADWPSILNEAQNIIKTHVDDEGKGVFSFTSIFEGTQYQRQAPTVSRYLQDLGILIRGRRTAEGAFNWTLKPRKVNVRDVRKARAKRSAKTGLPAKVTATSKPKASKPSASLVRNNPKQVSKLIPLGESLPMLVEVVESLRKENDALKTRIAELEAHNPGAEIAERVSKLICELTAPPKN